MDNAVLPVRPGAALTTEQWKDLVAPLLSTLETNSEGRYRLGPLTIPVTSSLKQRAAAVQIKVESILAPAESLAISGHISLLLQHYYKDSALPDAVMDGLSLQWLECLESFPEWAVKTACVEYLKADKKGRKPTPGQIVDLAQIATSKYNALLWRCRQIERAPLPPPPKEPPTPEQLARINEILREAGLTIKTPELQEKAQQKTCPVCKGKKVVRDGELDGESVRVHTCLRCYGSGFNKFSTQVGNHE